MNVTQPRYTCPCITEEMLLLDARAQTSIFSINFTLISIYIPLGLLGTFVFSLCLPYSCIYNLQWSNRTTDIKCRCFKKKKKIRICHHLYTI